MRAFFKPGHREILIRTLGVKYGQYPSVHENRIAQARRLAREPNDRLTGERLAQLIEEFEFRLHRRVA